MEEERKKGIDYFDPAIVMALLMAGMSDAAFLALFALLVPVVGIVIAAFILGFHYFAAFFLLFLVLPKLKRWLPKLILLIALILPLPLLFIGIIIAIFLQNRIVEFIVTQLAIQGLALLTGGIAEVAEVGAVGGAGAEAAAAGAEAAAGAAEAAAAATEAGAAGAEAAEAGAEEEGAVRRFGKELIKSKVQEKIEEKVSEKFEGRPSEVPEVKEERKPSEISQAEKEAKAKKVSEETLGGKPEILEELGRELLEGGKTGLDVPRPEKKSEEEEYQAEISSSAKVLKFPKKPGAEEEEEDENLPKAA